MLWRVNKKCDIQMDNIAITYKLPLLSGLIKKSIISLRKARLTMYVLLFLDENNYKMRDISEIVRKVFK